MIGTRQSLCRHLRRFHWRDIVEIRDCSLRDVVFLLVIRSLMEALYV